MYFSPASERESKAFANRLGLETDWNSCILLSSASDPFGGSTGYLESYDIKAQLPRGIENIRPHLENVDDIPLHVSLFAECGPEAATEMIKIFQDYGEVVCCIGSSLNTDNIAAFAKVTWHSGSLVSMAQVGFMVLITVLDDCRRILALAWSRLGWVQALNQGLLTHWAPRSIACLAD